MNTFTNLQRNVLLMLLTITLTNISEVDAGPPKGPIWSEWSPWSPCSRSCDGGVTLRKRHCFSPDVKTKPCVATSNNNGTSEAVNKTAEASLDSEISPDREYQICNLQPCPALAPGAVTDFRTQQCVQYNEVPYQGKYFTWRPDIDAKSPCTLHCQSTADSRLVVKMDDKVIDGTRCKTDSLDMCIEGKCRRVGCDLKVGSMKHVDACGVCGGNNSSCSQNTFGWEETPLSHCSAPCGGGYMMARPVCRNKATKEEVESDLCDSKSKPLSRMAPCNQHPCPARWEVDDWGPCSHTCGAGYKLRAVKCIIDKDGKKVVVAGSQCPDLQPPVRETCNVESCPQWFTGIWSECNAKCGQGLQHRNVICRDSRGQMNGACSLAHKPVSRQPCTGMGRDCELNGPNSDRQKKGVGISETNKGESTPGAPSGWLKIDSAILPHGQTTTESSKSLEVDNTLEEEFVEEDVDIEAEINAKKGFAAAVSPSNQILNPGQIPSEPTVFGPAVRTHFACGWLYISFIVEDWEACSVPCGEGIRRRKVECKIFLEFSKTVATLPDRSCPGPKPPTTEICFAGLCETRFGNLSAKISPKTADLTKDITQDDMQVSVFEASPLVARQSMYGDPADVLSLSVDKKMTYEWKEVGYTTCSESCLGGLQESKIICVDTDLGNPVNPMNCRSDERPEVIVRTCNDHPCPPRWNVSDFSRCSKSCGGGVQIRNVSCIQEVRHGGNNILKVSDALCPQPPPITQQFCNVVDCPAQWTTTTWTKCSRKCGGGNRFRKVRCQQFLALGELADKSDSHCPGKKPATQKSCNVEVCSYDYPNGHQHFEDEKEEKDLEEQEVSEPSSAASGPIIRSNANQEYVQASPRLQTVRLKVGGKATLYKGTKVKIRCPVKKFDRSMIEWSKDNRILSRSRKNVTRDKRHVGKAFVTAKGSLRIKKLSYADAGVYTCTAQNSKASIEIIVKGPETYKSVNDVWSNSGDPVKTSYDYESRKDLGVNNGMYGVVRNEPPKFDDYAYGYLSTTTPQPSTSNWKIFSRQREEDDDDHRLWVTPNSNFELTPGHMRFHTSTFHQQGFLGTQKPETKIPGDRWMRDRDIDKSNPNDVTNFNDVTKDSEDDYDDYDKESSPGANMDWDSIGDFNQYPKAAGSDGHTTASTNPMDILSGVSSGSGSTPNQGPTSFLFLILVVAQVFLYLNRKRHLTPELAASEEDTKSSGDGLRLEWTTSEWSRCSQTCGKEGKQIRTVDCIVIKPDGTNEVIPESLCSDSGLVSPQAVQECGLGDCPKWQSGNWQTCKEAKCLAKNTGFQTRDVRCTVGQNSTVEEKYCEAVLKPTSSRTCSNEQCRAIWQAQQWSECNVTCGSGSRKRDILCVWKHGGTTAGDNCRQRKRPSDQMKCHTQVSCNELSMEKEVSIVLALTSTETNCTDDSKYCGLVKSFDMCSIKKYQDQCCHSCNKKLPK